MNDPYRQMRQWAYLKTGLRTMKPFYRDVESVQRAIDSVPVTYLVLDDIDLEGHFKRFWNLVCNFPDKWRLVRSVPMAPYDGISAGIERQHGSSLLNGPAQLRAYDYARTDAGSHSR